MARGSVNSFHLLKTVAGFPQTVRHIGTCVEGREETRAELDFHPSDSTDLQAVPNVPPAGLSEPKGRRSSQSD